MHGVFKFQLIGFAQRQYGARLATWAQRLSEDAAQRRRDFVNTHAGLRVNGNGLSRELFRHADIPLIGVTGACCVTTPNKVTTPILMRRLPACKN
jgi:hypothetical protein